MINQIINYQNKELYVIAFLIMLFGATNLPITLLLVLVIGILVAAILPFGRNIQLMVFLIPSVDVFTKTPYVSVSLATLLFLIMFGRYMVLEMPKSQYFRPGLVITLIFIIFELMHIIYNPVMLSSKTLRWLLLFSFFSLIMFDQRQYTSFQNLRAAFLLGLLTSTAYGLLQQHFFPPEYLYLKEFVRFSGGAGDPNSFGLFCLLTIFFFLPNVPRKTIDLQCVVVIIAMLLCGSLTVSRSFFIVAFASLVLYFILYFRAALGELLFRFLLALMAFGTAALVFYGSGQSLTFNLDILSRFSGENLSQLTGARSDIFKEYISQYFKFPMPYILFGVGINGYLGYFNHLFAKQTLFSEIVGPHNTYLEMFISFGLIGAAIILFYIKQSFRAVKVKYQVNTVYRIAFIPLGVFLLYCFSLQNLAKYSSYFILLLIIYSTYRRD
ncbi:O-antigen ligase family protein [Thalassotalea ganghwensis]